MQKIFKQDLSGGLETAKVNAIYTWEKDEIAWYFCTIHNDVFKVQFTGEHWLSGNKWRYNKIYQYKYLESSGEHNLAAKGLDYDGISHGDEHEFYTTKEEAIELGLRYVNNVFNDAVEKYKTNILKLSKFR
jgi:hypothetical protein